MSWRSFKWGLIVLGAAGAFWAMAQVLTPGPRPLVSCIPAGPLIYLEARDFSGLLKDWNSSNEKALWLKSANYQVFSRSRLFARLQDSQTEYATAAGFPSTMPVLESVAGGESALALYDVGKLEFLYVTRLPASRLANTVLTKARSSYETRKAAGVDYFVRVDPATKRVAAFAITNGLLMLATREDLISGALILAAGQTAPSMAQEPWFDQLAKSAKQPGELRLMANMAGVVRSPHFRSYWIQGNVSEMKPFASFASDLFRENGQIREERMFVRAAAGTDPQANASAAQLTELVPPDAGVYQAWSSPSVEAALDLMQRKILAPRGTETVESNMAPAQPDIDNTAGSAGDLETRIDRPPVEVASGQIELAGLRRLIESGGLDAMLEVQSSRTLADGVFVGTRSATVLLGKAAWNPDSVRAALVASLQNVYSASGLGLNWVARGSGSLRYYELDGLGGMNCAIRDRLLIIGNDAALTTSILARQIGTGGEPAVYLAGYRHARELAPFTRMMRLIDAPQVQPSDDPAAAREPQFFSENLSSLGATLGRVQWATIVVRDSGTLMPQTVIYRFGP